MCVRTHFTSDAQSTFDILNINGVNNKLVHPDLLNSYTVLGLLPFYHFKVARLNLHSSRRRLVTWHRCQFRGGLKRSFLLIARLAKWYNVPRLVVIRNLLDMCTNQIFFASTSCAARRVTNIKVVFPILQPRRSTCRLFKAASPFYIS